MKKNKFPIFFFLILILIPIVIIIPLVNAQVYYHIYLYVGYGSVKCDDITSGTTNTLIEGFHNLQFISGHQIVLTALNTVIDYNFANWEFFGYISGNSTINPLTFYITSTFTLDAFFYVTNPEGYVNFNVTANTGGTIQWNDLTTPNTPYEYLGVGSYVKPISDNLTFTAIPTQGYIFDYFTINTTNGITNNVENVHSNTFNYTLTQDFNVTANFVLSTNIPDSITLESYATDNGKLVLYREESHILIFSCTEDTSINPIGNIAPQPLGTWFIEMSDLSNTELTVDSTVNYNYFNGGSIYNGQFNSALSLGGNFTYSQWVLMRVNVDFSDEHMISRVFVIQFVPQPTPTPNSSTILPDILVKISVIFGNLNTDLVFIIFGIICGLATWKFALTGLIAGIGISTLFCALAGLLPIWAVGLAVVLDVTLIVIGSGLLNKTTNNNNSVGNN